MENEKAKKEAEECVEEMTEEGSRDEWYTEDKIDDDKEGFDFTADSRCDVRNGNGKMLLLNDDNFDEFVNYDNNEKVLKISKF